MELHEKRNNPNHKKAAVNSIQENDYVMTVEEVASYIELSISFVYKNLDKIPHKRVGGNIRFFRPTIDAWLLQCSTVTPIMDVDRRSI